MTYEWLALDAQAPPLAAAVIDTTTPIARALLPRVEGELFEHGPWWIDFVFEHAGRTWLAGQHQWGRTQVGDYAVYRMDPDGAQVRCCYRHLPQSRIALDVVVIKQTWQFL